jgi:FAD/FMN-containing dehydrogenase
MISFRAAQGGTVAIAKERLDALRASLRGSVLLPGDPGYDVARTLWNGMIDRRPAATVRPLGTADVIQVVNFAREHRLLLAVKGAGTTSPARPPATTVSCSTCRR